MRISTKGRYGLRAMLDLEIYSTGDQVTLKSIAKRQDISEGYLEQVFSALRKAGLIKGTKGSQGGYILDRSASKITVGEILRALEGDLAVVDQEQDKNSANDFEHCISTNVWGKINDSINNVVDSITLDDLITEYKKQKGNNSFVYYI